MIDDNQTLDFIRQIVAEDYRTGKWAGRVHTRFPPEPNGYLHIGHAKAICLNYGIAKEFGGKFNLRFDDTNPSKEDQEYVDAIIEDVRWLGAGWEDRLFYASDYFEQMYQWATELIKKGKAYVCDLPPEQLRQYRGTLTEPGKESPYRNRTCEENLDLFERMRKGEFPDGSRTLRAKIDMAHPNLNMRDPVMYRILHQPHQRQGNKWCVYPTYDWAHGLEDSIEGITHSICTLEFENHRPLYDWFIDAINEGRTEDGSGPWGKKIHHPQQIEFARLNLSYTVLSKRKLGLLVQQGHVNNWDDPRMPTIAGLRRRGYSPSSIWTFAKLIGVNKYNSTVDIALLEHCLRDDLNKTSPRVMVVLKPLKVVITNWPGDHVEYVDAINNPEDPFAGTRKVPFSKVLFIEKDDFMEQPPSKFYRLAPGREVRLRYAYLIKCHNVIKDSSGQVIEVHCTYDPQTKGGQAPEDRKVKATLHWVSAAHALDVEVRLYDRLFLKPDPDDVPAGLDFTSNINPNSLRILSGCKAEPSLSHTRPFDRWQFERLGYFCTDPDSSQSRLVFNRTVELKDSWAKIQKRQT